MAACRGLVGCMSMGGLVCGRSGTVKCALIVLCADCVTNKKSSYRIAQPSVLFPLTPQGGTTDARSLRVLPR
jgi:hypothetical protein